MPGTVLRALYEIILNGPVKKIPDFKIPDRGREGRAACVGSQAAAGRTGVRPAGPGCAPGRRGCPPADAFGRPRVLLQMLAHHKLLSSSLGTRPGLLAAAPWSRWFEPLSTVIILPPTILSFTVHSSQISRPSPHN